MQQSYLKWGKFKKKSTLFVHKVSLASLITETLIYFKEKQSCLKQMCSDWRRDALEGSNSRLDGHSLNVSVLSKGNEPQEDCNCNHYFALCLKHQNILQNRFFGRVRAQCHSTLKPSAETISGGFFHWFLCGVLMSADLEGQSHCTPPVCTYKFATPSHPGRFHVPYLLLASQKTNQKAVPRYNKMG